MKTGTGNFSGSGYSGFLLGFFGFFPFLFLGFFFLPSLPLFSFISCVLACRAGPTVGTREFPRRGRGRRGKQGRGRLAGLVGLAGWTAGRTRRRGTMRGTKPGRESPWELTPLPCRVGSNEGPGDRQSTRTLVHAGLLILSADLLSQVTVCARPGGFRLVTKPHTCYEVTWAA